MFGNKILDFKDELLKGILTHFFLLNRLTVKRMDECDNALNFILQKSRRFRTDRGENNRQERSYNLWRQRKALRCAYSP